MLLKYTINKNDNYTNLKEVLKIQFKLSDRLLLKLKRNNKIYINNQIANINSKMIFIKGPANDTIASPFSIEIRLV